MKVTGAAVTVTPKDAAGTLVREETGGACGPFTFKSTLRRRPRRRLPRLRCMEERLVRFRPRAVLVVLGIILAGVVLIQIVQAAQGILIWIFVAIFLALALNPAVEGLQRRGVARRGLAVDDRLRRRDPRDRGARRRRSSRRSSRR